VKNPNSPPKRLFGFLKARWTGEDYPGAEPRFQLSHFAKDVAIFVLLPVIAVIVSRSVEKSFSQQKKPQTPQVNNRNQMSGDVVKSEIIDFLNQGSKSPVNKHSPGSLVKLKLLNSVETYSNAPVHAQIIDLGLGRSLLGGILIGDATPDSTFERINIIFRYARDPSRDSVAYSISARALSLNGSLGLVASKREGFFARSVLGSASGTSQNAQVGSNTNDLKDILFRALASGFVQEFSNGSNVEKNRSQVLTLQPETEFFAELTDFFPGGGQK
jgi:hypothetical protein